MILPDDLKQRLITASLALSIVLGSLFFATYSGFQPFFPLVVSAIIAAATWEYVQMAKSKGFSPPFIFTTLLTLFYTYSVYLSTQYEGAIHLPHFALGILFVAIFVYFFLFGEAPFITIPLTFFSLAYLTLPLSTAINIVYFYPENSSFDGRWALFFVIAVAKMSDTAAYFIGKRFGKRKLAPVISPNKTWEGAGAGVIIGIATGIILYLIALLISPFAMTFYESLWLSAFICVLALLGDLSESVLKRDSGIKDSSQIPGLGGILDIVDSLIFTLPLMYIYLRMQ